MALLLLDLGANRPTGQDGGALGILCHSPPSSGWGLPSRCTSVALDSLCGHAGMCQVCVYPVACSYALDLSSCKVDAASVLMYLHTAAAGSCIWHWRQYICQKAALPRARHQQLDRESHPSSAVIDAGTAM